MDGWMVSLRHSNSKAHAVPAVLRWGGFNMRFDVTLKRMLEYLSKKPKIYELDTSVST